MRQVSELKFASKYPFSAAAKSVVKDSGLGIESIPGQVIKRASALVLSALRGEPYSGPASDYPDILRNEVLAFPVAKILVSLVDRFEVTRKFCRSYSEGVLQSLDSEPDDVLVDLAMGMKMKFSLSSGNYFAEVNLADYLRPELDSISARLVNQQVAAGKVFLTRRGFARLISEIASHDLRMSLPVDVSGAGASLKFAAKEIESTHAETARKAFSKSDFGEVKPEFFPPCISKIYSDLATGQNVNHSARFAVAAFLNQIGMAPEQIVEAFRHTPNFNERTTKYQVARIAGPKGSAKSGYNCPGCDKMKSYNLCVADCPVSHPVQFYEREISKSKGA